MTVVDVLRRGPVLRLTVAGSVSEIGDWMLFIALPLVVLRLTGSPLVTATVFVLELLPSIVIGPFVGVLADRMDPWRLMSVTALLQAAALLPLLLVSDASDLPVVYAVVIVEAALGTVIEPCRAATAAAIVPIDEVSTVNRIMAISSSLARLVGAPLGGILVAWGGLPVIIATDAATFLIVAIVLAKRGPRVLREPTDRATPRTLLREWRQGLTLVTASSVLRRTMVVVGLMALAQGGFVVLFVIRDLHGGDAAVGLLRGIQAVGALVGGLLLVFLGRRMRSGALVSASLFAFGILSLIIWNAPYITTALPVYVTLFAVVGAPGIAITTGVVTIVQTVAEPLARGRVLAILFAVEGALQAAGMLVAGLLGTGTGLTVGLQVQAGTYIAAAVLALGLRTAVPRSSRTEAVTSL